jgi:hypothetical protein
MDDDLLSQAFAAGAKSVNVHRFGREYEVQLWAYRDLDSTDGVQHTEHASAKGRGPTPALALREAIAKLRPTPAIEVREIKPVGRRVVPLALAESTTRIKGARAPEAEVVVDEDGEKSPAAEPEPETAEAG